MGYLIVESVEQARELATSLHDFFTEQERRCIESDGEEDEREAWGSYEDGAYALTTALDDGGLPGVTVR